MSKIPSAPNNQIELKLSKSYKSSEANEVRLKSYLDTKLEIARNFLKKGK